MATASCPTRPAAGAAARLAERARALLAALRPAPAAAEREVVLDDWQARSFAVGRRPLEVRVLEGEVLLTAEGDAVDHVVAAAGAFVSTRRGRHVVAALAPSRLRVTWR
jgi:hypothetical protein